MTFTWTPDFSARKNSKPNVQRVKFGDGYEQRNTFGLNTDLKEWTVTFSLREEDEADDIEAFLDARGAVESFAWTAPGDSDESSFVCDTWAKSIDKHNRYTITATFREVPE